MTEELPPPQAAARMPSVASGSQAAARNRPFNGREFTDLTNANDEKREMIDIAMSEPQMILADRREMDEVNSW